MPYYGRTLEKKFKEANYRLEQKEIVQIGIQLINALESIHAAGFTYNDLKCDNIVIDESDNLRLIDFGFATRFRSSEGEHLSQRSMKHFRGNMIFASLNMFEFKSTSRRDDLI